MECALLLQTKLLVALVAACAVLIACMSSAQAGETVRLSELDLSQVVQGWGKAQADKSVTGTALSIGGRKFAHGVGTHSVAGLTVGLKGGSSRFSAWVGVDDDAKGKKGSVEFLVWGDGKLLWRSGVMRERQEAKRVEVDVTGVQQLTLAVSDGGDGYEYDHADWAEAEFAVTGARPQALPYADPNPDPVLNMAGKSAAPLATPVELPFEKILPGRVTEYELLTAHGEWGKEYLLRTEVLGEKGFRYVQKAGRSCQNLKPWLMVCNLKTGQGLAVSLAYSGNWVLEVQPRGDETVVRAAASPASLKPFESFNGLPVPGALVAEFTGHWDYGAQPIVRFIRAKLRREMGPDWPPVQYNTWYATSEKLTEPFLLDAARAAAEVGCELFTVDAGWYGKDAKADWCYLGEWEVNKERLPNGLEAVIAEVRKLGMKFGLWVEIECVTPNSPLGKEHPDWYLRDGERLLSGRGVLNLGHPQALAWVKSVLDRLVTTYRLDYLKMDFNTDPTLDSERFAGGSDPLYAHYRGLAELWKHLRTRYPQLVVENCSSGSLRQDLMTAALTDTHWVSDNVENKANLAMNFSATYLFPPEICSHWTTTPVRPAPDDTGPGSALDLESQFTANLLGHFGLSGRLDRWDAGTRKVAAERIALYKRIRPILRHADVYHLTPQLSASTPRSVQAALYVDADSRKALLFAFQGGAPELETTLRLRGLPVEPRYRLRMPAAFGPEQVLSGAELVEKGLPVRFPHRGASAVIEIEPAPERP